MNLSDLLAHAPMSESARDVPRAVLDAGELSVPALQLAADLGITDRTVFRALNELEQAFLITRESGGGRGKPSRIRAKPDTESRLRLLCQSIGRERETPGAEYTPLQDEAVARASRVVYCRATGRHAMADRLEAGG